MQRLVHVCPQSDGPSDDTYLSRWISFHRQGARFLSTFSLRGGLARRVIYMPFRLKYPLDSVTQFCPHMDRAGNTLMSQESPAQIAALRTLPHGLVVDVGCFDGKDAVAFANAGHRVWSFEPNPEKMDHIRTRIHRHSQQTRIKVIQVALSNFTGTAGFMAHNKSIGGPKWGHALGKGFADKLSESSTVEEGMTTIQVPVRTLDSFFEASTRPHVTLLKIDAQGYDYRVLKGAAKLLSRGHIERLVFEFTPDMMPGKEGEAVENLLWLKQMDYLCTPCYSRWFPAKQMLPLQKGRIAIADYIAVFKQPSREAKGKEYNRGRMRGFDNIVCVPKSSCTNECKRAFL